MTPPQPNSMSSGCAPKASNGAELFFDFSPSLIGSFNGVSFNKGYFGRVFPAKVGFFSGTGNVMRAMNHRLHPAQPRVARRANVHFSKSCLRQRNKGISAFMQFQSSIYKTSANNLTFVRNIHKKIWNIAGRSPQSRITRTHHANAIKQTHVL